MQKLTREQAAVISAYTGILADAFSDMHTYAEQKLKRPVFTHEFGLKEFCKELKEAAREDFLALVPEKI